MINEALVVLSSVVQPVHFSAAPKTENSAQVQTVQARKFSSSMRQMRAESSLLSIQIATQFIRTSKGKEVGELGEKWRFPSDHLPVGATVDDFHIASWNVLNTAWMAWIDENDQGLAGSMITEENIREEGSSSTVREQRVVRDIIGMIDHPTHPRSLIALQECGQPFLKELKSSLPPHMKIVYGAKKGAIDENVVIYDSRLFDYLPQESSPAAKGAFPTSDPHRPLMDLVLVNKETGRKYRLINAHVPGDPNKIGYDEFAAYALSHQKEGEATIALGDMNFDEEEMGNAFGEMANDLGIENRFKNFADYCTNIDPKRFSKMIDHIFIHNGGLDVRAAKNSPDEVMAGLQATVDLLQDR